MKQIMLLIISSILINTQTYAQERQIRFFSEHNIDVVTKDIAEKYSLYPDIDGFQRAELFQINDSLFAIEIIFRNDEDTYRTRTQLTSEELSQLRNNLSTLIRNYNQSVINQEGRAMLMVGNTLMGLSYYAVAPTIIVSNKISGNKLPIATYMFTAATSYFLPYYITQNKSVTMAQASMSFHGQSRGLLYGLGLSNLISTYTSSYDYSDEYWEKYQKNQHFTLLSTLSGGVGFGLGSYYLAKHQNMSIGQASVHQLGIDYGLLQGVSYIEMFNISNKKNIWGTVLGTGVVWGIAGNYFANQRDYSVGDAIMIRNTIFLGATLPLPIVALYDGNFNNYLYAGIGGSLLGIAYSKLLLEKRSYTSGDALLVSLGKISGLLLGLGAGFLIMPESHDHPFYVIAGGTLGTIGGFRLMNNYVSKNGNIKEEKISCNIHINPLGLFQEVNNTSPESGTPIIQLHITF